MIKIIVSILFLLPQVSFGANLNYPGFDFASVIELGSKKCEKPVQYITGGNTTPCTGYLFSPEKEYEVRLNTESHKHLKLYVEKQNELMDVMNARIGNLRSYNTSLSDELQKQKNLDFWKSSLYFVLGVVVTGAIARNVN